MKSIVISDIHLGISDNIAECVKNRKLLVSFIEKIRQEKLADEVVINGDFLDQWFWPATYVHEGNSDIFFHECAKNNQEVIDAFSDLIKAEVPVIYVPGNHDITMTNRTLEDIFPGIIQSRDVRGLGKYRTGAREEVVIEHGHRYESFCAPDMFSNREFVQYGEPILAPGYIYARVGVQSYMEGMPKVKKDIADIPIPTTKDTNELIKYAYYRIWKDVVEDIFPVNEDLDEKFIHVKVDGFEGDFSLDDIIPKMGASGITSVLYNDFGMHWEEIQRRNLVASPINLLEQLQRMSDQTLRAGYAKQEYIDLDSTVDVVIFGHTHVPFYQEFEGYDRKKLYVNEGTWIDNNTDDPDNTATFAMIDSDDNDTNVFLLKCVGEDKVNDIVEVNNKYIYK